MSILVVWDLVFPVMNSLALVLESDLGLALGSRTLHTVQRNLAQTAMSHRVEETASKLW
jgi:hypothetical protein